MFLRSIRMYAVATLAATAGLAAQAQEFKLTTTSFTDGGSFRDAQTLNGFGCKGGNLSPALQWSGAPQGTESFAITVYDPDAPSGSGWWHWVVYNLPVGTTQLAEGAGTTTGDQLPAGAMQGRTDFGAPGFGGACPPAGGKPHRYAIMVHALKVKKLPVPTDATAAMVGLMINLNRLGSASLLANHGR